MMGDEQKKSRGRKRKERREEGSSGRGMMGEEQKNSRGRRSSERRRREAVGGRGG
jgi:hypothetical protein